MCQQQSQWFKLYNTALNIMQSKMAEKTQSHETKVSIIGYFPNKMVEEEDKNTQLSEVIRQKIHMILDNRKKQCGFWPTSIQAEANNIAILDKQNRAWLITDFINEPICLSDLVKLKVHRLILGFNQVIINTKVGCILITWGGNKPISDQALSPYPLKNIKPKYCRLFEAFTFTDSKKNDRFFFPNLKKVTQSQSLFRQSDLHPESLVSYPDKSFITVPRQIVGLSVGKYHKLCWDSEGKLYSWGLKSLALGHQNLPQQDECLVPQPVHHITSFVLNAFAGVTYSLAVTLEGKIYEWGVKKIYPKGEELIFQPREVVTPKMEKFVDIKGKGEKYAALTLAGHLYVWGKGSQQYFRHLKPQMVNRSINQPTLLLAQVVDFSISQTFLSCIIGSRQDAIVSDSKKKYLTHLKTNIRSKLRYNSQKMSTEGSQRAVINSQRFSSTSCLSSRRQAVDPIQIAFSKRQAKKRYIQNGASNTEQTINYIMEPTKSSAFMVELNSEKENQLDLQWNKQFQKSVIKFTKRSQTQMAELFQQCQKRKQYADFLVKGVYSLQEKNKIHRVTRNQPRVVPRELKKKHQKLYSQKLEEVLSKRQMIQNVFFQKTIKRLENQTVEYRMKRKQLLQELKKKGKEIQVGKITLQKTLIQAFLVKLFLKPTVEARQLKINDFRLNLKLRRLENNLRGVFIKNRIMIKMKKMRHNQLFRYFLLSVVFKKYVKRFRERKLKQQRRIVVQELFKSVIKQKIKMGIATSNFNVRKLQKFRQWVSMVRVQRKKCLKYMWKVFLLSNMKINSDRESSTIFYLPRKVEELTFQTLYQEKVALNPMLKLPVFLEKHSIFKIKATYFQKLITLFSIESKKTQESSQSLMGVFTKTKRARIKFLEEDDMADRLNLMQTDILPYSIHYNLLIHPKNYDLTIPEIMKQNDKWVKEERKLFDQQIQLITQEHAYLYTRQRRAYDIELASFIRKNYDSLSEKRWKYILEYNQTKQTFDKIKKTKQLRRLLKLIRGESKLEEDCLPEKHILLQEALRRPDAPQMPSSSISFTMSDFKKYFKPYYEALIVRAKQFRRTVL